MRSVAILGLCLVLSSCLVSPPKKETIPDDQVLVVGQIIFEGTGRRDMVVNTNGTKKNSIKVTISDGLNDDNPSIVGTNADGAFWYLAEPGHSYYITHIYMKRTSPKGWSSLERPLRWYFSTADTPVSNLGTLVWTDTPGGSRFYRLGDYEQTKANFVERYPDSHWAQVDWTDR